MEISKSQCPKCTGLMERGFVMDRSLTNSRLLRWVEGEPEIGGATGLKLIERKTSQITRTDKCDKCGYLEFYGSKAVEYV
jgi:predicted nucleic-acid-binding Zn-ribbon protein